MLPKKHQGDSPMQKTLKIYDRDSHLTTCEAIVLHCEFDEVHKAYAVILDQTVFFPEGGGQFADLGYIGENASEIESNNHEVNQEPQKPVILATILDVQISEDIITHYADAPLEDGTKVTCHIDWNRRFDFMQQHSAEHILSSKTAFFIAKRPSATLGNPRCVPP